MSELFITRTKIHRTDIVSILIINGLTIEDHERAHHHNVLISDRNANYMWVRFDSDTELLSNCCVFNGNDPGSFIEFIQRNFNTIMYSENDEDFPHIIHQDGSDRYGIVSLQ